MTINSFSQNCPKPVYKFKFNIKGPVNHSQTVGILKGCDPDNGQILDWSIPDGNFDDVWIIKNGEIMVNDPDKINSDNINTYLITVKITDNYIKPLSSTAEVEIEISQKINVIIYPNPFSDQITFEYDLIEYSHVIIQIYDAQGKIMNEPIINENQSEGKQYYIFNSRIASGVYFYRILINDNYIDFGRIVKKK